MESLFINKGPFDINFIIKNTSFSKKIKFSKQKIKNVSNLVNSQKGDLTFFENIKYINNLKNTNASFCLIKEKFAHQLEESCIPIISKEPLLDFIIVSKLFYPDANSDNYKFKQNNKYRSLLKKNVYIDNTVKISKNSLGNIFIELVVRVKICIFLTWSINNFTNSFCFDNKIISFTLDNP